MIKGIFETHLNVTDLERSQHFYEQIMGLEHAYGQPERGNSFYWVGGRGNAMLGIWQKEPDKVQRQHFAFHVSLEDMKQAVPYLEAKGIAARNFLDDDIGELYVFGWMPAVSVYFTDPDGHSLEFISMLPDEAKSELGMVPWSTWERMHGRM
ncbi:catechol 2,3-dioxygenase-like lactoylglutathione lyase family enzyme [Paenibacillus amylolyticus]|uniref:Catechol 2,3-dioxygenase-like lactoylglutathione lyase family enzyme n=1 Tax=Paenibacillus amylolyticus TaxID=1451 RepID=A0AAP5H4V6_PAEAM|nr:VOC family protein [Paenibacillus amylolyticus]MDR6723961.1 catechol 2,3-dioxygenase-like lactoylglutathione lyase family enzyme [Paenibacillus amylolyticus]